MPTQAQEGGAAKLRALLDDAVAVLARARVNQAHLDAQVLLAEAAGASRAALAAGAVALDDPARIRFAQMVARRAAREPLAYIIGRKEFYSIEFEVSPAVLIPRPETEIVVDAARKFIAARPNARVLDIGTGTGAIALAIGANAPRARIVASDISADALALAERNAARLGMRSRVEFRPTDCFDLLDEGAPLGKFDLIVSNPPYVRDDEIACLQPEISRYEPRAALAGGADGMDFYRRLAAGLKPHLAPDGAVIVEVGAGQAQAVSAMLSEAGCAEGTVLDDLSGIARVVCASR